jgi:type IV secretory pathway VirB2 component (pilin)
MVLPEVLNVSFRSRPGQVSKTSICASSPPLRLFPIALLLLVPLTAHAQGSPFDTGFNAIQALFTGTIAKVASLVAIVIGGYPIHPELFDRLYNDWSSLDKFQRTRGVLRLMAAVIHALWEREDRGLMILPASVPLDADAVQSELTRDLPPTWLPVIEKDIDGSHSLPLRIDRENAAMLGRYSACRRVARTLYLGSAPMQDAANKGLDDRQIKLGCVQPGNVQHVRRRPSKIGRSSYLPLYQ